MKRVVFSTLVVKIANSKLIDVFLIINRLNVQIKSIKKNV